MWPFNSTKWYRDTVVAIAFLAVSAIVISQAAGPASKEAGDKDQEKDRELVAKKAAIFTLLRTKSGRSPSGREVPPSFGWWSCEDQYRATENNKVGLYFLISEHLTAAERQYFTSKECEERRKGLGLSVAACRCALDRLKDLPLATKIVEAFIVPHLTDADPRRWKYLSTENVLETMADVYAAKQDAPRLIEVYKQMIDQASNANTADGARLRLAQIYVRTSDYKRALQILRQIDDNSGVGGAKRMIPEIEKKLAAKKQKENSP